MRTKLRISKILIATLFCLFLANLEIQCAEIIDQNERLTTEVEDKVILLSEPSRYEEAISSLKQIGHPALPVLNKLLQEGTDTERINAARALGEIGIKDALPDMLKSWELKQDEDASDAIAYAIFKIEGKESVKTFIQALNSTNKLVRSDSAEMLGYIEDKQAIPALTKLLSDIDPDVKSSATSALKKLGYTDFSPKTGAVQDLSTKETEIINIQNGQIKENQDTQISTKQKNATLTRLINTAKDKRRQVYVRVAVINDIDLMIWRKIPPENRVTETKRVCDALLFLYEDRKENEEVIRAAGLTLSRLGDRRVVEPALEILNHPQNYSTKMVIRAMGIMGQLKEKRGVAPLAEILKTTDSRDLYRKTATYLGNIGGVEIIKPLVENRSRFGEDDNGSCRRACLRALKENRELLINIVEGKQEGPRDLAITALGIIGDE